MSWRQIARKDFEDAMRDRSLYFVAGMFGLLGVALGYFFAQNVSASTPVSETTNGLMVGLGVITAFVVPIAGLGLTQSSIVSKRIQGELKVLLGLPFSRRDLILGTFLGRAAIVVFSVAAIAATTLLTVLALGVVLNPVKYLGVMALVAVLGVAFVGIALGISAIVGDTTRSAVAAFGAYLLFVFRVWDLLPQGVTYLLNEFSMPRRQPEWVRAFGNIDPLSAFGNVVGGTFPQLREAMATFGTSGIPGELAVYQTAPFSAVVLFGWILVPVLVGYWRFSDTDL
jgi:ABC-2 type transport system permease protein